MTDKKPEISKTPASASSGAYSSPGPASTPSSPSKGAQAPKKKRSILLSAFIIAFIIAVLLAAALWYQQQRFDETNAALTSQMQTSERAASRADQQAQQALSLAKQQSEQLSRLETALSESKEQLDSLEDAFQTLTDSGSDLVLLNDVDHLLTIAQQQLQLGGNVGNAIISLETAQAQLARANRPRLASLQESINGDLDRLRAASTVDVGMLSTQLDELAELVSVAPLLVPDDAAPEPVPSELPPPAVGTVPASVGTDTNADAPWWRQGVDTAREWTQSAWESIREDLGQFIAVRRVDDPAALLMSPDQATRFRETLRLRVMTAQLALMMKQPKVWAAETESLVKALESRFDQKSRSSRQAVKIARQLADTSIETRMPTVSNSLQAVAALREESNKEAEQTAVPPPSQNGAAGSVDEPTEAPSATPTDEPSAPAQESSASPEATHSPEPMQQPQPAPSPQVTPAEPGQMSSQPQG